MCKPNSSTSNVSKTFPQKGGEKSTQVASVQGININWFALPK